jgi:hypothetical protein
MPPSWTELTAGLDACDVKNRASLSASTSRFANPPDTAMERSTFGDTLSVYSPLELVVVVDMSVLGTS